MDLYKLSVIKEICEKFGFSFSKGFGQNFLTDRNILEKIVEVSGVDKDCGVIEIGPGFGVLTKFLLEKADKVVSIEIDKRLKEVLDYTLAQYDNFEFIENDALKIDFERLIEEKFSNKKIILVANLPYYVTTPIITKLLESNLNLESITIMVQKEVAQRLVADEKSKENSSISLFVKYYADAKLAFNVSRNVFVPAPNVDSAVVYMKLKKERFKYENLMFKLIKNGFLNRRKTILNSFCKDGVEKEKLIEVLNHLNIDPKIRAEKLSLTDFQNIATKYTESCNV
ncbi:MAG: 16S rRNA (adenine(1518)-N(6)/adenine(1519)-N(6))-dimethyltransferase RsmA [Peptoniphilaceae bacterium]|uniref:16S rRNA (adenine(1518)-N(6)/adenine(1519)-N(6))- dimethyltransferase RsmA n=1 Tax=Parvimonas sp. TaxID=1944660 RepID=UPI0025D7B89B|nr:16S rRNA (adenine(1518)-N(6)/adenine(1519)-N(6))-dimethyltransferase RsmA [Parvimonas sp.]MCI5997359.1 16S rRNA (adenine(1518)-N(6)/adenine(1519)-N(6))-dimethyltransferase RsmA [Parvimonas sp.]MDD7765414.1 16S rRNA (adenine(1518)-N(6)/adenine(1519)-N(6))-dimethyltransferase RsmA [Peptoniphilaceae bacterium]MDY3050680.1 16S rRNA (adenine(1518)-N(6)/adenine(1519)-N(6))-dimethyltransferase RsmA [Parvimonas sp.]